MNSPRINTLLVKMTCGLLLTTFSLQALPWGQNGHRIVGQIADLHLTKTTRKAISQLLDGDLLPEVTTWADEMRSDPSEFWQKRSAPWHYINLKAPQEFDPAHYPIPQSSDEVKDIYGALLHAIDVLKSKDATLAEKQFSFRFLVHLVGDIHQPLHAGHAEDKGGNDLEVTFFGKKTNLHSVWDTDLIESQNLSYTEFAAFIDTRNPEQIHRYLSSTPADWLTESLELSSEVYQTGNGALSYAYVYQQLPKAELRLLQAGIRLSGLLNSIYDPRAKAGVQALAVPVANK